MNRNLTRVGLAALLAFSTAAAAACAPDGPDRPGAAPVAGAAAASVGELSPGDTVEFVASEFMFAPADFVAEAGDYTGVLVNDGDIEHDIVFEGGEPIVAAAGESVEFDFTVPEDGIRYWCSIPGHEDAGMVGSISTGGAPAATAASGDDHVASDATPAVEANSDAAPYALRDPRPPARGEGDGVTLIPGGAPDGGDLIEWELVVEEKLMTVADGFEQLVWTFGGEVPGPVLRTHVGDTVRVHLVNPPEAAVSHSIDFHASQVSMEDEMASIAPGEDLVYEFTTDYAGVWMYHCGTAPVLHHIANGMYGMVIVDPESGLPPVDDEYFFVQNEWYLGPQGEPSSLAAANQAAPAPDFQMFNGVAAQYADNPIEVATGEDIRMFVLNVGPSVDTSFHVVGGIFHEVIKEGVHLTAGNEGNWGAQAVDLAPAQGAVIEMTTAEDGTYALVNHAFNFPGRGAIGLFTAS
ncbi:MAG TPA: multicopper oxidase domain-containing protein [Ilumatobacteraceae bacterium]|nr:multicopper oxidase domain-containing protein [Ilumatobacteraceae bacterium]